METIGYIFIGALALVLILVSVFWALRKMKGAIEIVPEKYSYASGEDIKGKLTLTLRKPASSSKLIVGLKCERTVRDYSSSRAGVQTTTYNVFEFNQPLEGPKEYAPSLYEYNFSIKVPQNISDGPGGMASTLIKSAQILLGKEGTLKWYLYSELQCKGVNLSKKVQINVA